ncbi:hypothetical protein DYH09_00385 [bacterium CPR1]|nr:hypothetical protein [bacterium CPR1]
MLAVVQSHMDRIGSVRLILRLPGGKEALRCAQPGSEHGHPVLEVLPTRNRGGGKTQPAGMTTGYSLARGQLAYGKENFRQVFLERVFSLLASHLVRSPEQVEALLGAGLATSQVGQFRVGSPRPNQCTCRGPCIVVDQQPERLFQSLTGTLQIALLKRLTEALPKLQQPGRSLARHGWQRIFQQLTDH